MLAATVSAAALIVAIMANHNAVRAADATERQAIPAEAASPAPLGAVAWRLEHQAKKLFMLRNTGTDTATGVKVHYPDAYDLLVRANLGDGRITSHASIKIIIVPADEIANLTELGVTWDGNPWPVRVPIPYGG